MRPVPVVQGKLGHYLPHFCSMTIGWNFWGPPILSSVQGLGLVPRPNSVLPHPLPSLSSHSFCLKEQTRTKILRVLQRDPTNANYQYQPPNIPCTVKGSQVFRPFEPRWVREKDVFPLLSKYLTKSSLSPLSLQTRAKTHHHHRPSHTQFP
jgi:hypothetical protein